MAHYWYNGEQVPLLTNPRREYLLLENPDAFSRSFSELSSYTDEKPEVKQVQLGLLDKIENENSGINDSTQRFWTIVEKGSETLLTSQLAGIIYKGSAFYSQSGKELILTHIFYVKLKDKDDVETLFQKAKDNNVYIEGRNAFMPEWFVLSCDNESKGDALEMANSFYESGLFAAAEPDLMENMLIQCVNDAYFRQQWALQNTGQLGGTIGVDIKMCEAWQISEGNTNIIVALIDHGIELNHPDFANISTVSFDSESGTSPSQVLGNHGTACAGIIGATANNYLGVAGIAPNATLMSISNSLAGTPNSRMKRADAVNFARTNGAAVINNSWGSAVPYQVIDDAINLAVSSGRGGLGCIVVFASGNDYQSSISYPSNLPGVIAVGATDRNDLRADFSNYGTGLDIAAPGVGIYTTDRQGTNGYNSSASPVGDYYANFSGTSAAAPHVAAVAALVLSVDNSLPYEQVVSILTESAEKVGGYTYNANGWSAELGFGRLNAYAALNRIPGRYSISGSDYLCSSLNYTVNGLPSGSVIDWSSSDPNIATISTAGNAVKISDGHVTITATINIPNRGGTVVLTKYVTVGTISPWVGGTFNDGGSGTNQPLESTYNEVYNRRVYISLSGSTSEFSWDEFYRNGNVTWHHPVGNDGLIIDFGDPLPVYHGDYIGFSVHRTNSCGMKSEPLFFYYVGPTQYFRITPDPVSGTIAIAPFNSEQILTIPSEKEENKDLIKILLIDKIGNTVFENEYTAKISSTIIDVSHLKPDEYLLRLFTKSHSEMHKIVIDQTVGKL